MEGHIADSLVSQEPKPYVEALLEVHTKNADIVQKAFRGDVSFGASLDKVMHFLYGLLFHC